MPKISALPPMTTADGDDEAPIVDDSVATTKKFTLTLLKTWLQSLTAWIATAMLADSLITTRKFKPTIINQTFAQTSNYANSTTTATEIFTFNYTAGPTNEKLFLIGKCMAQFSGASNANIWFQVGGVDLPDELYMDGSPGSNWQNHTLVTFVDVAANATVAIKMMGRCTGAGTLTVSKGGHSASFFWTPYVKGFSMSNV